MTSTAASPDFLKEVIDRLRSEVTTIIHQSSEGLPCDGVIKPLEALISDIEYVHKTTQRDHYMKVEFSVNISHLLSDMDEEVCTMLDRLYSGDIVLSGNALTTCSMMLHKHLTYITTQLEKPLELQYISRATFDNVVRRLSEEFFSLNVFLSTTYHRVVMRIDPKDVGAARNAYKPIRNRVVDIFAEHWDSIAELKRD